MIPRNTPITKADLDALATLANAKLNPATPFVFQAFASPRQIGLPEDIKPEPTYGGAGQFLDGAKVTLWLYGYKTIAGMKTYSAIPLVKAFTGAAGFGNFSMTWNWVSVVDATKPDGYIAVIPLKDITGFVYLWRDIGNVETLSEDGSLTTPPWIIDNALETAIAAPSLLTPDPNSLPCGHGIWFKMLNAIRRAMNEGTDIEAGNADGGVVTLGKKSLSSGPWCVSVCGSGANTLQAWIARDILNNAVGSLGFTESFSQCYDAIEFYFRNLDASLGVNITAQNQLLAYRIGSDLVTANPAHFHLRIVNCSDGHIKVQDAGGGTVRADLDITAAGAPYDLSFNIAGVVINGLSLPKDLDFTFTTAAATASVAAVGIELNNDVRKCIVPDSYCEIEFNNPIQNRGGGYDKVLLCTSCLQLTLTENNNTPGIWVAKTLPTFGLMTYLDVDLPQYKPSELKPASSRRIALNDALPFIASVDNRGALWPIFRDKDFIPDSVVGRALNGSKAWQTIGTQSVNKISFTDSVDPSGVLQTLFIENVFVPSGSPAVRFYTDNPQTTLYVKAGSPPTVNDFDASAAGGTWLALAPGFATNTTWFYGMLNPTDAPIDITSTTVIVLDATLPNGTFFPTTLDDFGIPMGNFEGESYRLDNPGGIDARPIPLLGYCVYRITLRRQPINNGNGIAIAPAGANDLSVKIGVMLNWGYEAAGVFTELQTIIIPAGQPEISVDIFWPVLSGNFLVWQCDETIVARSEVNFQPSVHSTFAAAETTWRGAPRTIGFYNGAPRYDFFKALLTFKAGNTESPITLPLCVEIYNDLETVLNLL